MFGPNKEGSQAQRAGNDSTLIQATGDINIGVSEKRAHEIARETSKQVISEFTADAMAMVQDRILKLDDRIIAALIRENRLQVFADPGFQRTYRKAQEGAAVSDRDSDYDLLSALMVDRAERGTKHTIRAGIDRAIEVIDRIDDEALRGLTVFQAVLQYKPAGGDIDKGLDVMNRLLGQLIDGPLPAGSDWLDHLDILDVVRPNSSSEFRKFNDFWPTEMMPGYISRGVEESDAPKTWSYLGKDFRWLSAPHKFKEGFVRIEAPTKKDFERYYSSLPPEAVEIVSNDADEIFHLSDIDESCREPLMVLIRAIPKLRMIEEWWDTLPFFSVTAVGRVLARANAERLDVNKILPPLD